MKITSISSYQTNNNNKKNEYYQFQTKNDVFVSSCNSKNVSFGKNTDEKTSIFNGMISNIKMRSKIKRKIKELNLGELNLLDYSNNDRIKLIDKILSNAPLYENKNFMKQLPLILSSVNNAEESECKIELLDKLLSNERLYRNKAILDNCAEMMLRTRSQTNTKSKIAVIDKILSDDNLLNLMESNIAAPIVRIISSVYSESQVKLANEVLSYPELYNNYEFMVQTEGIVCSNDIDINAATEIIRKAMADKRLSNEESIEHLGKIITYSFSKFRLKLAQYSQDDFSKIMLNSLNKLSTRQIAILVENGTILDVINSKTIDTNQKLLKKISSIPISPDAENELLGRIFGFVDNNYTDMNLIQKRNILKVIQEIISIKELDDDIKNSLNIEKDFEKIKKSLIGVIVPTQTSQDDSIRMMKGFFSNKDKNLNDLLTSTDFTVYGKKGLPLSYSRKQFWADLNNLICGLSEEQKKDIFRKLDITPLNSGYDGIIDLTKLLNEGIEGKVLSISERFILKNSIETGNKELDNALNSLIKGLPEFINIIGKKQHKTQDYSLDIHTLTVLQEALSNPEYQSLTNEEKFCLKFAIIFHDIAKPEGVKDDNHPYVSALYAKDILNKSTIKIPHNTKNRIYELVKNHHWLADYGTKKKSQEEIASFFRRKGDFKIARIMSEADLKGVDKKHKFYDIHASSLSSSSLQPIEYEINSINKYGQIFLTSKIIDYKKFMQKTETEYNGQKYHILDFTKLDRKTDLFEYGFEPNTTVDDIRLLIHTVKNWQINNLENVFFLDDPRHEGFLCTSYVTVKNHPTYASNTIGVSVYSENINIANASQSNQNSGYGKSFADFSKVITDSDKTKRHRTLIPDSIKIELNLTNAEYSILYSKIQRLQYISQLDNIDTIIIGDKQFSGKQIKQAILNAEDNIINNNNEHNEVNLYNPKVNSVVAKVSSIDDISQELLDYAHKHNLPIFLIGE